MCNMMWWAHDTVNKNKFKEMIVIREGKKSDVETILNEISNCDVESLECTKVKAVIEKIEQQAFMNGYEYAIQILQDSIKKETK